MNDTISYTRGHKRPNGKLQYYIREKKRDAAGKENTKWHGPYNSKQDREEALLDFNRNKNSYARQNDLTLNEALKRFLADADKMQSEHYGDTHTLAVTMFHSVLQISEINLSEIKKYVVADFVQALKKLGKTNSTIKNYLSDLRIVYETICNQNGIESLDPFHRTRFRLKHEKKERYALWPEEINAMFAYMEEDDWSYRHAFRFVCETGLRPGELFTIRHADIGYDEKQDMTTIMIDKQLQIAGPKRGIQHKTYYFKDSLKTGEQANRTMYLPKRTKRFLDDHMQLDTKLRDRYNGDYATKHDLAKGNMQGYPYYRKSLLAYVIDTYTSNQIQMQNKALNYDQKVDIERQAIQTVSEYDDLVFTRMPFLKHGNIAGAQKCESMGWALDSKSAWNDELKHYAKRAGVTAPITKYNLRHSALANMHRVYGLTFDEIMQYTMHTSKEVLMGYAAKFENSNKGQIRVAKKLDKIHSELGLD